MELISTKDGSFTLYSSEYDECYHSLKDGALQESLYKHVIPAFSHFSTLLKELFILDICFGLGYNTLATLYYVKKEKLDIKLHIYSPELDTKLIEELKNFTYPQEFNELLPIIQALSTYHRYEDTNCYIEIANIDARKYIKTLLPKFHIVYQDAFSVKKNRALWTNTYFQDIFSLMDDSGIMTTYSIASNVRYTLHVAGFYIYEYQNGQTKKGTIATKQSRVGYTPIDMDKKLQNSPQLQPILD